MHPSQSEIESQVRAFWRESRSFEKSNAVRTGQPFVFFDGCPFATGKPHLGHLLVSVIKDVVARYQCQNGRPVPRTFGWDCHGLPVEAIAQTQLNTTAAEVIRKGTVEQFNQTCRGLVSQCEADWHGTIDRLGRWVDWGHTYRTMDRGYMESVWWAFHTLYQQGRIYRAHRIMPYSPKLMTPLSNFETSDCHRDVVDRFVVAKFRADVREHAVNVLVYTTTPWTLPTNAALCVNPDHTYAVVQDVATHEKFLLNPLRLQDTLRGRNVKLLMSIRGSELVGTGYRPIYDLLPDHKYRFVADSYVGDDVGTGIVHLSPAFGEDDYRIGKRENLPVLDLLDEECRFDSDLPDIATYKGQFCKDVDGQIVQWLMRNDRALCHGSVNHSYPYCERTDHPLIYRAINAWYLRVEDAKDELLANNAKVRWVPEAVGTHRFQNWLQDAKDWNISRNRLWGSCIPLWEAADGELICVRDIAELERLTGKVIEDLHRDYLDAIVIERDGKRFKRVPEVLDCWFESGCMPFAQHHFPFENKELVGRSLTADFVVEGLDQTRGWFYSLMVLSTLLFKVPPFRNVVVNGLLLAGDGQKMSKSRGNYEDPEELLTRYGADPLRAYLCSTVAVRGEPVRFSADDLETVNRAVIQPLLNAFDFYQLYSEIDDWQPGSGETRACERVLDAWIVVRLHQLTGEVRGAMDAYELHRVIPRVSVFMDELCNWFIRLSRRVFWNGSPAEKQSAYDALYTVLLGLTKLLAPFIPFTTDHIYGQIVPECTTSVHLTSYPLAVENVASSSMINNMAETRRLTNLARKLRAKTQIKTRQPLSQLTIYGTVLPPEYVALVRDELNVLKVESLPYSAIPTILTVRPNHRKVGRVFNQRAPVVCGIIQQLLHNEIEKLHRGAGVIAGGVELTPEYVEISNVVNITDPHLTDDGLTVVLDTRMTPELIRLGWVAEFRSQVQGIRKSANMSVQDRLYLEIYADTEMRDALERHGPELHQHLLVTGWCLSPISVAGHDNVHRLQIDDNTVAFVRAYREEEVAA